ncbi:hypothetical protein CQ018_08665 [Arthrobacter sp. MYb227]|uniref:hypothetical protein n=1 Tax=Arthrobacter sp. MYb227 TaxID=1848601 RepID=UPI000CFE1CC1|nr:hypothetical protein [Arthrobacter sp. MYb227]PQZ93716.1 hypothetical protein CQ018_08665 [Arthrobacter sp. MYb227]
MSSFENNPSVKKYMSFFDEQAKVLPRSRQVTLRAEILSHISALLPENAEPEAVSVALRQLGSPVEIVSQELEMSPEPTTTKGGRADRVALVVIAVLATIWLGLAGTPLLLTTIAPTPGWLLIACGFVMIISAVALVMSLRRLRH